MNKEHLNEIIEKHSKWMRFEAGGERANLRGANLSGADLSGANLRWANLEGANLYGADLRGASLYGANLRGANLSEADLSGADLFRANLRWADLFRANLRWADLEGAKLSDANNIDEARLNGCAGDRSRIKSIFISDKWPITYTKNVLQIGCQKHKIEEWRSFSDEAIAAMDDDALEFWVEFKDYIFSTIDRFPAV